MSKHIEDAVKEALLMGNFEATMECCFCSDNLAKALVLASCRDANIWQKAQAHYFAHMAVAIKNI